VSKKKPWHDDDRFWEEFEQVLFSKEHIERAPDEIERVITLLGIKEGSHILDLCCGIGRHSLELARRGLNVTGVDRTRSYLATARRQAKKEKLKNVEFIEGDMRTYCSPDTFDDVINLYTSFGYFEDIGDDRKVLMNVHRSLKQGGSFIIQMMGKEVLARIFQCKDWHEDSGFIFLTERKICQNWGWTENRWIIIKGRRRTEFNVNHRLYSADELTTLMVDCGFRDLNVYGDLEGSPYDNKARILLIVARK